MVSLANSEENPVGSEEHNPRIRNVSPASRLLSQELTFTQDLKDVLESDKRVGKVMCFEVLASIWLTLESL